MKHAFRGGKMVKKTSVPISEIKLSQHTQRITVYVLGTAHRDGDPSANHKPSRPAVDRQTFTYLYLLPEFGRAGSP